MAQVSPSSDTDSSPSSDADLPLSAASASAPACSQLQLFMMASPALNVPPNSTGTFRNIIEQIARRCGVCASPYIYPGLNIAGQPVSRSSTTCNVCADVQLGPFSSALGNLSPALANLPPELLNRKACCTVTMDFSSNNSRVKPTLEYVTFNCPDYSIHSLCALETSRNATCYHNQTRCLVNSDCPSSMPFCNRVSQICATEPFCRTAKDCSPVQPYCRFNLCSSQPSCKTNSDCPARYPVCRPRYPNVIIYPLSEQLASYYCDVSPACRSNSTCPAGTYCNTSASKCVARPPPPPPVAKTCTRDSNCDSKSMCNPLTHLCVERSGCTNLINNGPSASKADLVFVGDGFMDNSELSKAVLKMVDPNADGSKGLFSMEPYKSNKNKFNIWIINAGPFIGWTSDSSGPDRAASLRYSRLCSQGDYTVVVSKKNFRSYAYFSGDAYISTNPDPQYWGYLMLHEFGHAFGNLADEYVENGKGSRPRQPNCASNMNDARAWWGTTPGAGYFKGCSYVDTNYRPTANSIMRDNWNLTLDFGPVNRQALQQKINQYR